MPAPTEQHAQDQRSDVSDARKRIDAYFAYRRMREWNDVLFASPATGIQLNVGDIESVLADADRDRQFAEAVRAAARDECTRNGGAPCVCGREMAVRAPKGGDGSADVFPRHLVIPVVGGPCPRSRMIVRDDDYVEESTR